MDAYIKKRIESYRTNSNQRPLVIDVSNVADYSEILNSYFTIKNIDVLSLPNITTEIPSQSDILEALDNCKEKIAIVTGIDVLYRLLGKQKLNSFFHLLTTKSFFTNFIILCYQCQKHIEERDPRNNDFYVYSKSLIVDEPSSLVFVSKNYEGTISSEKSLSNALKKINLTVGEKIFVTTTFKSSQFNTELLKVEECKNSYDLLCLKNKTFKNLLPTFGSQEDWDNVLLKINDEDSIETFIDNYISTKAPLEEVKLWNDKSKFERFLLFILLKYKSIKTGNYAVDYAIDTAQKPTDFIKQIYNSILCLNVKEEGYWNKYNQREKILKDINEDTFLFEYCNNIEYLKKQDAIYYLTDNTAEEKKRIIKIIDEYKDLFTKSKLLNILPNVYSDLAAYLKEYKFDSSCDLLTYYFNQYKYLKVTNQLTQEFKDLVDKEAINRSFKKILMCRSEKLTELNFDDSVVYFFDALGVEFLSFIEQYCHSKDLGCKIHICRSNLPSITEKNTEFKDYFATKNVKVKDEKRLDQLKHSGKDDYDFDKNQLPIHIIEEFNIIEDVINDIRKNIKNHLIKKAIIVSDHGATRLAILNTEMEKTDLESSGMHGGRVCQAFAGMETIPNAIIENDYCILADYNCFKGGRVGKVEMHGGATLEEVTVPIIEISDRTDNVEITILTQLIKVSFKKSAQLVFVCNKKLSNISIVIEGITYNPISCDGDKFTFEMPNIKKSGTYKFDVWSDNQMISSDNEFKVEKESATSNDLWG